MNKKALFLVITVLLAGGLVIAGITYRDALGKFAQRTGFIKNGSDNTQNIGGQKDEHGCLVGAGYSWCEAKQKCLRTWEESCGSDDTIGPPVYDAVKNYLQQNLSTLSPEKEVLGGKFYVTGLELLTPTKASVDYEDGHNAFHAVFDYQVEDGKVTITNFTIRPSSINTAPGKTATPTSTPPAQQSTVQLTFQPMQCEQEPWQQWYEEGTTKFLKAPTDEELIKTFYGTKHSINITSAQKKDSGEMTCDACNACKKSYYFTATVSSADVSRLETLGWKK